MKSFLIKVDHIAICICLVYIVSTLSQITESYTSCRSIYQMNCLWLSPLLRMLAGYICKQIYIEGIILCDQI